MEDFLNINNDFTPVDYKALMEKAEKEIASEKYIEASQTLCKLSMISPQSLSICLKLAHCSSLTGSYDLSISCYNNVIQYGTESLVTEAYYGLGELLYKKSQYVESENAFKNVLTLNQNFEMASTVHLKLGIINKKLGILENAFFHLKTSSLYKNLLPEQVVELILQLGSCFELLRNNSVALGLYSDSVKIKNTPKNMVCMAWGYIKINKYNKALIILEACLKKINIGSKEHCDVQFLIAVVYLNQKKYLKAEKILQELLRFFPNDPYYLIASGLCENGQLRYGTALKYLYESSFFIHDRCELFYLIGLIYEKMGFASYSLMIFAEILKFYPGHENSRSKLMGTTLEIQYNICVSDNEPKILDIINIDICEFPFHSNCEPTKPEYIPPFGLY